jgi:hypothetical protein
LRGDERWRDLPRTWLLVDSLGHATAVGRVCLLIHKRHQRIGDTHNRTVDIVGLRDRAVTPRIMRPLHARELLDGPIPAAAQQHRHKRHTARDQRRQLLVDDELRRQKVRAHQQ